MKKKIKYYVMCALVVLVAVLIFQNTAAVTLRFLMWEISMSRVFLYLLLFLAGGVSGYLFRWIRS